MPIDFCALSVTGARGPAVFVRYSIVTTSADGQTSRYDYPAQEVKMSSLPQTVSVDVAKLGHAHEFVVLRNMLLRDTFTPGCGGQEILRGSRLDSIKSCIDVGALGFAKYLTAQECFTF